MFHARVNLSHRHRTLSNADGVIRRAFEGATDWLAKARVDSGAASRLALLQRDPHSAVNIDSCSTKEVSLAPSGTSKINLSLTWFPGLI